MGWSFGFLTITLLLADARAQTPCSMNSSITVTLEEGNVTASQILDSNSPYQAALPVIGLLSDDTNGITLVMTSDNPLTPNPNNTFRIEDFGTGTRIRLITSVDRDGPDFTTLDDIEIISFRLKCTINADSTTTAYSTVTVNIKDINDNSPQFINMPYSISVEELTPVGTTVYRQISALDKDSGLQATINYAIFAEDGSLTNDSRKFNLTSDRFPYLVINESLDFEPMYTLGQTTFMINVVARDLGTPPRSAIAQVNMTVTDNDDLAPAFVYADCLLSGRYCVNPRYSTSVASGQVTNPLVIYPLVGFTRQAASTIRALDRDTLRSPLTFRIVGTSPVGYETYFSVAGSGPVSSGDKDIYTATLTQLRPITRSIIMTRVEVYILAVQANGRYEERATVTVEIDVPNSNPPNVTTASGVNIGYIYENSRLGQNVLDGTTSLAKPLQLIITDPDDNISGQKTAFNFSVTGTGLFNVDYNGYIYLASGSLDYETTKIAATFIVRVTETNTAEKRSTDITVTILVLDLNDNDPVFTSTGAVRVSVLEGDYTLSSRLLAQVNATDADSGANALLTYSIMSIEPAVPSGFFTINANTGDVSLSGRVTYPSNYVVVVKATDSAVSPDAVRSATKNLYVNVTSAGNNAPQIPSKLYTIIISESTVNETAIFIVPATDPDGQVLSFAITAGNAAGKFSIDSSGQLRTVGSLDREVIPTYSLTVTVRDTTTPAPLFATTTVSVILTDVNDNNPVFPSQYQFTVPENQPIGTSVGTVTATDADQPNTGNSELTYRLNLANNVFAINPNTGQITTLQPLDYESQNQYIFEVLAVDRASDSRTGTVSVTVIVTDVQDSVPLFTQQIFTANVAEGNDNAFVIFVSAVDVDMVDNIQYKFLSPATATTFTINSASGQINTAVALDYETQRYYEFFVTTVDGQGSTNPSSTATVRVTVLDQNDNNPVLSLSTPSVQVFEDAEVNHVLVIASATDADAANTSNSEIRFLIVSVSPSSGLSFFSIDRDNGILVIEKSLTNDPGVNQYQIIVRASDRGTPVQSFQVPFIVTVFRNTAPLFVSNSVLVNINHTMAPRTFVASIQAVDADPGDYGRLNYQLLGDSIASRYFQLVAAGNGVNIMTFDELTKDTGRTYYLTITAKDNAGIISKTATTTVTVNVNRNLQDPRWLNLPANLQTMISITENDPLGQAVFTLSANDLDILPPDNEVEYHLIGNDLALTYFKIDSSSGIISLIRVPVQNRTIDQFTVTVSLTDKGVPPRTTGTTTLFVNVLRNLQPPVYFNTSYYVQLREGVPIGTSVVQVSATDSDANSNFNQITYRIVGDDTAPNFFTVISSGSLAGWIITSGNLATDLTDTFRIRIEAADNGAFQFKASALVYVKVLRNLNRPQWRSNQFSAVVSIPETQNVDSVIYNLPLVTDNDFTSPDNITNYKLTGSTPIQGQNYYQVNATTGEVAIKKDLTRDHNITLYILTFQAYDLGTPSLMATQTFTLTVNVLRNTRPVFSPSIYSVSVDETWNVSTNILLLFSSDSDMINNPGGLFGHLSYRIASPASALPYFMVVVDNGQAVIRVNSVLINAPLDRYLLLVQVTDDGGLSDYAEVTIEIRRNLNAPQFMQASYVVNITEDLSVGSDINITVLARDADLRGRIAYRTEGICPADTFFLIDNLTGNIQIRQDLRADSLRLTIYTLRVVAYDTAKPLVTGTALVYVTVRRNLNSPVIRPPTVALTVPEDTNITFWGYRVNVTDLDSRYLTCLIIGNAKAQEFFRIEPDSCLIKMRNSLVTDPDKTTQYRIQVQVSDDGMPPNTVTGEIVINVQRDRFNPGFINLPVYITIEETASIGSVVYKIDVSDGDQIGKLIYQLDGYLPAETFFTINSTTGVITVRNSPNLDVLERGSYTLRVCVYDDAWPSNRICSNLTVVINRNPSSPQFLQRSYGQTIRANFAPGDIVIQITAQDLDRDKLRITNEASAPIKNIFYVNPDSGSVMLIKSLMNITTIQVYQFNVSVTDGRHTNPKTDRVTVTISVTPLLGPPAFSNSSVEITIPLTEITGYIVYTLIAQDPDQLGFVQYKLIGFPLGQEYFAVNPNTGAVTLRKALTLNPDKFPSYVLLIEAYDSFEPEDKNYITLIILVNKNLYAPEFRPTSSYTASIKDYDPIGTSVTKVSAQDLDKTEPENNVIYRIDVGRAGGDEYFRIDPNTGLITIINQLYKDTARPTQYTLYVLATDPSYNPKTATATIFVTVERNVAPTFNPNTYSMIVSETTPLFNPIITVFATDANPKNSSNGQLVFIIIDAAARNVWQIDEQNGTLSPRVGLCDIIQEIWEFTIQVNDKGMPSLFDRASVRLTITRIGKPTFPDTEYFFTKDENMPVNTTIIQMQVNDPQPLSILIYEIRGDGLAPTYFEINNITGVIKTSKLFTDDNNMTPSYTVRVFAYRQNNPLDYAEALVHIAVIRNPSAPTFLHGDLTFRIPESQPLSVAFGKVNATDPDVGTNGEITYSISEIMPVYASSYFFVNPNTGTLSVIGNLMDDPTTLQYSLTVVAKDNGASKRRQAQVRVTVIVSKNPNPPVFQKFLYTVFINENAPAWSDVVQVIATDKDNDTVFYMMVYNPPTSEYFRLNNNTGSITTATELWRDRTQSYTLKVTASDNTAASKTSTATVSVIVTRNPNPPVFISNQYEKRISEYIEVRAAIIRVEATDGDNPNSDSGRLRYSINATVPSIAANYFSISPTYGEINLARTLTTDEIQDLSVQLSAVAQDISESPKFVQAQVRIFIIRNQYAPRFIGGNTYTVSASDVLPVGYTLLTVSATDNDTNVPESANTPNAEIEYQIIGNTNSFARYFHVRQNGEVYVAQLLTFADKRDSVSVTIRATDKSWKPKYTDATLTVRINYTINQVGQLGFTQPEWIIDVFENEASRDLKRLDVEGQETYRISCSILSGNIQGRGGPVFSIRRDDLSKNCILTLMTSLDFETQQRYDLVVSVSKSITKRQAYIYNTWPQAKITVMVLDVNDNRPTFVFPFYPPFTGLQKKYISAISLNALVDQNVFSITARDADSGDNGNVTYHEGDTTKRVPTNIKIPFSVNPVDGVIVPTGEFDKADNSPRTFRFEVLAQDNPKDVNSQEKDNAEVVINLIEDKHRFVLVLKGSTPDQVLAEKERIRQAIQSETGLIAIIETIERRRILKDNKQIVAVPTDTDIIFVLSQLEPPNFPLIENSDPKIAVFLANNRVSALAPGKYTVDKIRTPYAEGSELQFRITKSYVWWLDDPWAALIAITAISILLCLVGLVYIIFTHARYEKYLNQYRVMQVGYDHPEFVEPPSFLREYETQSLQMYVPPDEAIQGTDTLALDYGADEDITEDSEGIEGFASAINPAFHKDEPNQFHRQHSEFPEGTTML
ncbi:hypothetical protein CHS0354_039207 [Potamilus streckersoni]|uniref:Cadherin domain-containing protein n=1 Tax=Potamilus streckersoni TaxID=2493646 RepID=A0AAE0WC72_9BIVA|nr:hypothetical protein CHS0354_039207 [Potamilus streckersoni]